MLFTGLNEYLRGAGAGNAQTPYAQAQPAVQRVQDRRLFFNNPQFREQFQRILKRRNQPGQDWNRAQQATAAPYGWRNAPQVPSQARAAFANGNLQQALYRNRASEQGATSAPVLAGGGSFVAPVNGQAVRGPFAPVTGGPLPPVPQTEPSLYVAQPPAPQPNPQVQYARAPQQAPTSFAPPADGIYRRGHYY